MNRKHAACDYTRSAPSYFAYCLKFSGFPRKLLYAVAYASPFAPFLLRTLRLRRMNRRFRRICRGPGWDSTVPWFDRQLQVESQGFGRPLLKRKGFRFSVLSPVANDVGSSAAIKDQPASPQPSPHPCGEGKVFFESTQLTPSGTMKPK